MYNNETMRKRNFHPIFLKSSFEVVKTLQFYGNILKEDFKIIHTKSTFNNFDNDVQLD